MLIHFIDIIFFSILTIFAGYNIFFVFTSFFSPKKRNTNQANFQKFVVIFPALKEDAVIINSTTDFLKQDYPKEYYDIVVISDKMTEETNLKLGQLPINLIIVNFQTSLKSKSLNYAFKGLNGYDKAIIMDADNIVNTTFLSEINKVCQQSIATQLHRTRKNANTPMAIWDGISEEVNNTIYRKGHVNIGLSSALIGSGMVFDFEWIKRNIGECKTFAEDKELEIILAKNDIFIDYEDSIYVYDEKTSEKSAFLTQRTRWAHAQFLAFSLILKNFKKGSLNITYIDKIFQWIPLSRQIRLGLLFLFSITWTCYCYAESIKWWILLLIEITAIALAIPRKMYNKKLVISLLRLPYILLFSIKSYIASFLRIIRKDMSFNSTTHQNISKNR